MPIQTTLAPGYNWPARPTVFTPEPAKIGRPKKQNLTGRPSNVRVAKLSLAKRLYLWLSENTGWHTAKEIARVYGLTSNVISNRLRDLEYQGYIERKTDTEYRHRYRAKHAN